MENFRLLFLTLFFLYCSVHPFDILIADFSNQTSLTELESLPKMLAALSAERFAPYGIKVEDRTTSSDRAQLYSNRSQAVIRIMATGDTEVLLTLKVEAGDGRKTFVKEMAYHLEEGVERTVGALLLKISTVFEESILARVQITTEPSFITLTLDGRVRTKTPWESFISVGDHSLKLASPGYVSYSETIVIAPGSNRFNFKLYPIREKSPVVKERDKYSWLYLVALSVSAVTAGLSYYSYLKADKNYEDLVTGNRSAYDDAHDKTVMYLTVRNISLVTFAGSLCGFAYRYFK